MIESVALVLVSSLQLGYLELGTSVKRAEQEGL